MEVSTPSVTVTRLEVHRRKLGQFGLDAFSFFCFLGVAGAYIGLGLLLIALLLRPEALWQRLGRDPMTRWFGLFAVLVGISLWLGIEAGTAPTAEHWGRVESFLKLWLFMLVAYALGGDPARVRRALGLALAGFLLGRLMELDAETLTQLVKLQRPGLGFTAIALAEYTAMALLGVLLVTPGLWQRCRPWPWPVHLGLAMLLGLLGLLLAQLLVFTLSRGVWLALAVCLVWLGWLHRRSSNTGYRLKWLALLVVAALALVLSFNWEVVDRRLSYETATLTGLLDGKLETQATGSISLRLHLWQYGLERWQEHPWWGWGPGAVTPLLEAHPAPAIRQLQDLHNIPLQLLVCLGLAGTAILALVYRGLLSTLNQARRRQGLPEDLYLLLYGALLLHLLCGLTNFRMFNSDWQLYWYLFAGAAYSFACREDRQAKPCAL